jgi:hypothetical protein
MCSGAPDTIVTIEDILSEARPNLSYVHGTNCRIIHGSSN